MANHIFYLTEALKLAQTRRGFCAPNPAVGALIVKEDRVLATGYHWGAGHAHAEIDALAKLKPEDSQGATLYVTLEPCCHWGKTPPCTTQIIARGIKEVFYGYQDPNPEVAGKGEKSLCQIGIPCTHVELPAINNFYQSYQRWLQTRRPNVTAKIALSLDGKIAGPQGQPLAITGETLRQYTHVQRKWHDAILTTAMTINRDNPQLNVRLQNESFAKPVFVLDSRLSLSLAAKIFTTAERLILFHQHDVDNLRLQQLKNLKVECIAVNRDHLGLNLIEVMEHIGAHGIHDLWVEAGGKCFQALLLAGLADRALLYVGAKWLGKNSQSAFADDFNIFARAKNIQWQNFSNDAVCEILF